MFSITREQFIEAALAETERLRKRIEVMRVSPEATWDQEQIDWWMTRIANVQFAIEHLDPGWRQPGMEPTEMRALMEILYG